MYKSILVRIGEETEPVRIQVEMEIEPSELTKGEFWLFKHEQTEMFFSVIDTMRVEHGELIVMTAMHYDIDEPTRYAVISEHKESIDNYLEWYGESKPSKFELITEEITMYGVLL